MNGPCREVDEKVLLVNRETGAGNVFIYDAQLTNELYEINEGWDGEQDVNIFVNDEFDTVLKVYQTPYQSFEFINGEWSIEEMY